MIATLFTENGAWAWLVLGLVLLALELVVPGVLLVWIGLAALTVGGIGLLGLPASFLGLPIGGWDWQAQAITFTGLALLFAVMGRHLTARGDESGADMLARPGQRLVGGTGLLIDAIEGGTGRVRMGDTLWRVTGPDMPAGTRVVVLGEDGGSLLVADASAAAGTHETT